jgi:hypothetical protein
LDYKVSIGDCELKLCDIQVYIMKMKYELPHTLPSSVSNRDIFDVTFSGGPRRSGNRIGEASALDEVRTCVPALAPLSTYPTMTDTEAVDE